MIRAVPCALTALVALPVGSLAAQVQDTLEPGVLVADHVWLAPFRDQFIVPLRAHGIYRVTIWPGAAQLTVRPQVRDAAPTFAVRRRDGRGMTTSLIELYPIDFAPHVFTVSAPPGADHVHLWVWEDRAAEDSVARAARWAVHLGLAGSVGYSGAYAGHRNYLGACSGVCNGQFIESTGASLDGGLLFSVGPVVAGAGFTNENRQGVGDEITWAYIEGRVEVFAFGPETHRRAAEVALRHEWGSTQDGGLSAQATGVGLRLDYYLTRRREMRGTRIFVGPMVFTLNHIAPLHPTTYLHVMAGLEIEP